MFDFAGFFSAIKRYWLLFALVVLIVVLFFSGTIIGLYNKARAKVPQLPAAK